MSKLRRVMDEGGFWELDVSTPVTLDGVARPVPGDPLPLGLARGPRLSRPRQVDFFQRFMAMPFVPSFTPEHGLSLQRVISLPLGERLFGTFLGQFNIQRLISSVRSNGFRHSSDASWMQSIKRHLSDKSLYISNFCSELLLTPDDALLLSIEACANEKSHRKKVVLHHKLPHHNLTVDASCPGLFVDQHGNYWDVPFTLACNMASLSSDSGVSYNLLVNHTVDSPNQIQDQASRQKPATLLPGLSAKCAVSFKKNFEIWRSEEPKLKMVQPYDLFLSNPHVSASTVLGAVATGSIGDNSIRALVNDEAMSIADLRYRARRANSAILADLYASASLSAQYGNFQRMFFDLSRFYGRLDIPCGIKFLNGATRVGYDLYRSQVPTLEAVRAILPSASFSFQQQIAGPFSLRVDSGLSVDLTNKGWHVGVSDPIIAIEYALQVLVSAKAVAWYSPKQQEGMIELRFFES